MSCKKISVYKPLGITPFDVIKIIKDINPKMRDLKMAYAGRLDPMADGVLLLIVGNELKNFDRYLSLKKRYEAKILIGFSTDSYDLLGLPERHKKKKDDKIEDFLLSLPGKDFTFRLPPFSSYKIEGKPLFKWALENRLDEIEIPKKTVKIESLKLNQKTTVSEKELSELINEKIGSVVGNFRQKEIKRRWSEILTGKGSYSVYEIDIRADSGFYVRSLADFLGQKFNTGGCLLSLTRTEIGNFKIKKAPNPWDF